MYIKFKIKGILEVKTGMHIGGNDAGSAIGAIDSPVIRDVISNVPIIPGSSLKGKLRSVLSKKYNGKIVNHKNDNEKILSLFGNLNTKNKYSRLIFSDMFMSNYEEIRNKGIYGGTEAKFENTINRLTAIANPRQIERVVRGAKFDLDIIYEFYCEDNSQEITKDIRDDITLLTDGMKILEYDYLGGHGSRGYGRVEFQNLEAVVVYGEIDSAILTEINSIFKTVNEK